MDECLACVGVQFSEPAGRRAISEQRGLDESSPYDFSQSHFEKDMFKNFSAIPRFRDSAVK
jgi:hypothetical protein